ncbi:MAG: bifunctional phosphoribosylaminoimidazolecarboxamide formyltransferase/inosine monophosphate cyclohydrolase [Candidatus Magasanikbacteria bacterium CG_4_10_14_0_2_um_filter_37_12]|uniref:Bifunctional purine biosynthesis protein PurH n=1 Tax=Candidatus Magasanikbacteria bacterium CG_4_10_14_0_2_um_filter_37_12 TaxID=1974637 RepID=A0A2M7V936_9BACT|nr:MAG: bifunctional phosphoribosylaminoimidazolecarboxamide formyltransferase/inosine monophosphate cyclohydrolase [Candidatus Magasanikbacteria bacterium CG_4_10_14_0_2_um_filter_37_12]
MNTNIVQPKRALISVSNKSGIVELAQKLQEHGVEIISTGGTFKKLQGANIPAIEITDFTGFPEIMHGRVKTLHPLVHGGILGLRDEHAKEAEDNHIKWIDLVVCNLYPFAETISKPDVTKEIAIENIDIGGPSMIRSAGKNVGWVSVVIDPDDYTSLLKEISNGGITFATRSNLQAKAFRHTAQYDAIIANYFTKEKFPEDLTLTYKKSYTLRYGENPHQEGTVYHKINNVDHNLLNANIIQGKELSYNNLGDADGALATLKEFAEPTCVVVKHANPCGVATGTDMLNVFKRAYSADSLSAFGGIIAINRTCTKEIADEIVRVYAEIVLAPDYDTNALEVLAKKKNMRVLALNNVTQSFRPDWQELKYIDGGLLVQDVDQQIIQKDDLQFPTEKKPTDEEIDTMLFAWKVLKHIKSNGILLAKNNTTTGIGMGQVSRVDAVKLAITKAGEKTAGSILASDAFFPFRDNIDEAAKAGIKAIIQPGGSIKDGEVIDACNEHGIAMVFTGMRCFKH